MLKQSIAGALVIFLSLSSPALAAGKSVVTGTWVWMSVVYVYVPKGREISPNISKQMWSAIASIYKDMAPGEVEDVEINGYMYKVRKPTQAEHDASAAAFDKTLEDEEIENLYHGRFQTDDLAMIEKVHQKHPDWVSPRSAERITGERLYSLYSGWTTTNNPDWIEQVKTKYPDWNPVIDSNGYAHGTNKR